MKFFTTTIFVFFALPSLVFASTSDFSRTLYAGMSGEDVRALQKILNSDVSTRVAESGPGSAGNETSYFGLATKRALVKFQEKYRDEVLVPVGLTSGTGVFGVKTRAKAEKLRGKTAETLGTLKDVKLADSPSFSSKGEVILMFPSQYSGKPGTEITLTGSGFTSKDNTIYFGTTHAVEKASSWNGYHITFKIPQMPKGNYPLYIKNARGESNKEQFFVVTDGVTPEPKIESITPEKVVRGGKVTIKGSGFTQKDNMVRTGVAVIPTVPSSDGKTLSFVVPNNVLMATSTAHFVSAEKRTVMIWTYVVNENGVSEGKTFLLEI